MIIKNLGPIQKAKIRINNFTIFIGDNGTGKTLAAYSLFAFRNWFEKRYTANLFSDTEVEKFIETGEIQNTVEFYTNRLVDQITDEFNSLNSEEYFNDFFKDQTIFGNNTEIKIEKDDIINLQLEPDNFLNWRVSWPYIVDNDEGENEQGIRFKNMIMATYVKEENSIRTSYAVEGLEGSALNESERKRQLKKLGSLQNIGMHMSSNIFLQIFDRKPESFYMPAERIGINMFRNKLNNNFIDEKLNEPTASNSINGSDQQNERSISDRYPYPIEAYIKFINNSLPNFENTDALKKETDYKKIIEELIPGKFMYNEQQDKIEYAMNGTDEQQKVSFNMLSSSLKSLFGLELFFRTKNRQDWLFIDEPEMNLHPLRQALVVELLYAVSKIGTHVVISTHSDYLIKKLINLIISDRINESERNWNDKISVYLFQSNSVELIPDISSENADLGNFDYMTDEINSEYYQLVEKLDDEA